jgi:hypothetical protein
MLACIAVMMRKLFTSRRVTIDSIIGGINIYFLMAFLWAILYHIINEIDAKAFNITGRLDVTRLLYFSYNTITTLGNGDIVPVNKYAMIASSLEAMAGQIYLAVFVAILVGLHISSKSPHTDSGGKP